MISESCRLVLAEETLPLASFLLRLQVLSLFEVIHHPQGKYNPFTGRPSPKNFVARGPRRSLRNATPALAKVYQPIHLIPLVSSLFLNTVLQQNKENILTEVAPPWCWKS